MGVQTMGSHGGDRSQYHHQNLTRQGSLYSLTLDEVQNHLGDLGKPIASMNLEELLKTVFTAESPPPPTPAETIEPPMSLTRTLSKKTVDEVWRDIQTAAARQRHLDEEEARKAEQQRQLTLGEMTLEDFLVKAGVVAESRRGGGGGGPVMQQPQQGHWMQYPYAAGQVMEVAYSEVGQGMVAVAPTMVVSSPSPVVGSGSGALSDTQTPGRKRAAAAAVSGGLGDDVAEKTVERRQKRMIKNRESAARSRARKQAYTNELENKVARLEEENERLKKQTEFERMIHCQQPMEPRYQLRRTTSAQF
ncbi:ABSCISIC ACID-INSENSITIVE 5-like protein 2 [Acorus gramineus]|uniref:ABSCISIC ACID-INSENSITIVE 5-like protein 2 n=1 Tax=Acorus gramineus TaxID=55184 RepID=A0AAV9BTR3_ACOGR|nr:ABSCISIC ACID-INSENSITIVE 5-like protein 2 [Acorus gramineus]